MTFRLKQDDDCLYSKLYLHFIYSDLTFEYRFTYDVDEYMKCDYLENFTYVGGCFLEKGPVFIYKNEIPVFFECRMPPKGREDLPEILEHFGLDPTNYDMLDLARASKCEGAIDRFWLSEFDDDRGVKDLVMYEATLRKKKYTFCSTEFEEEELNEDSYTVTDVMNNIKNMDIFD